MILFDPGGFEPPKSGVQTQVDCTHSERQRFRTPEEFSATVTPHLPRLIKAANRILPSEDLAWDAVLETLQRIWVQGSLPADPQGVLQHLVVKSCLHQRRCMTRRDFHEASFAGEFEPCCDEDPLAGLESSERAETLRSAILSIDEKYRVVLERVDLDGESYQAIARELDVPIGTIRSRLSRGRDLLRQQLHSQLAG